METARGARPWFAVRVVMAAALVAVAAARVGVPESASAQRRDGQEQATPETDATAYAEVHAPDVHLATGLRLPAAPPGFTTEQRAGVRWDYPARARAEAQDLMAAYDEHWPRIVEQLCGEDGCGDLGRDVVVRVALDPAQMRRLAPKEAPPPAYATGVTYPALGVVLLTFSAPETWERPPMAQVLAHELSHLALHRAVASGRAGATNPTVAEAAASPPPRLPRWFVEGLAIHQSGERSVERSRLLLEAAAFGKLVPLRELSASFPERAHHANLAYAQAGSLVGYLMRGERGPQKMRRLVMELRAGKTFDEALFESYYLRVGDLEREWTEDVERRAVAMPFVLLGSGVWALGTLLAVLAWRQRRKRHRETIARWAAEEEAERRAALDAARWRHEEARAHGEETIHVTQPAAGAAAARSSDPARPLCTSGATDRDESESAREVQEVRGWRHASEDTPVPKVRWGGRDYTLH
jgi:hypothetical protein